MSESLDQITPEPEKPKYIPPIWAKLEEPGKGNAIGPVCKYCDRLIDKHPEDHNTFCLATIDANPVPVDQAIKWSEPSTLPTDKETKLSYYSSSSVSDIVSTLQDKVSSAQEAREDLGNASREIEDAIENLDTYIYDVEELINNLNDLPEVDVDVTVEVNFRSYD